MVDVPGDTPGVECEDLCRNLVTIIEGISSREKLTTSAFHFSTYAFTLLSITLSSHHTFGLSWISGISKATHLPESMPKDAQEPFSSSFLVSPIP
jgi:hypothetical protein